MKPAPFTYVRPGNLAEALQFLAEHPDDAKPIAGGQSLMPLLNLRLTRVQYLVDIGRLPGLGEIQLREDGGLLLGGLVRHRELVTAGPVRQRAPLLAEAAALIGHPAIRHRGTLGGSLAHADPAAELPTALVAMDAAVIIASPAGERECPAGEFFLALFTTALQPGELVVGVRTPPPPPHSGWAYLEMARRHGDFAMVGVAAGIRLSADKRIHHCRLVFSGVADTPYRATDAEQLLLEQRPAPEALAAAAQAAAAPLDPPSDLHASGEYRKELAEVYAGRALTLALQRAQEVR